MRMGCPGLQVARGRAWHFLLEHATAGAGPDRCRATPEARRDQREASAAPRARNDGDAVKAMRSAVQYRGS